jgi:TolB protein
MRAPVRFIILITFGSFSGCAALSPPSLSESRHQHAATPPPSAATAVFQAAPAAQDSQAIAQQVQFDGSPEADAAVLNAKARNTARIGMYGELVSYTPNASDKVDGAGNISPITTATEGACFDPAIDPTGQLLAFASTMHSPTADIYVRRTTARTHTQLTADPSDDVMPAFSPDGTRLAFASNRSGNWDLYVMPYGGGAAQQITSDADHELHPSWSPDGRTLVYCRLGSRSGRWEIWTVDVANPAVRNFLEYGRIPVWGPDVAHNRILFQRARRRGDRFHSIWTLDYVDGNATNITEIVSAANAALINPAWSPDGRRVVFSTVIDPTSADGIRPSRADVWVVNMDGTGRTAIAGGDHANFQPIWSPDNSIYFVSNRTGVDNIWSVGVPYVGSTPAKGPEGVAVVQDR